MFDSNVPEHFAPNERPDFERFLDAGPDNYWICLRGGDPVGAFGFDVDANERCGRIRWIMAQAASRHTGIGTWMMQRILDIASRQAVHRIAISASQKSAPYFARFGARERSRMPEGWGPGLDRVEMEIDLTGSPTGQDTVG